MNNYLRNLSLKKQIIFLTFVVMAILLISYVTPYTLAKAIIEKKVSDSASKIINQVKESVTSFYTDMDGIANSLVYSPTVQEYMGTNDRLKQLEMARSLQSVFVNIIVLKPNIKGIQLYNKQGLLIAQIGEGPVDTTIRNNIEETIYTGLQDNISAMPSSINNYYSIMVPIYNLSNNEKIRDLRGTCVFIMDVNNFRKIVSDAQITPHSKFLLIDANNKIIADESSKKIGTIFHAPNVGNKESYIMQNLLLSKTGWEIASIIPKDELLEDLNTMKRLNYIVYSITFIFVAFTLLYFSSSILKPVKEIIGFMNTVSREGIGKRLTITSRNEIGMLAAKLNSMLAEIDILNKEIQIAQLTMYQLELSRKQALISALQSQVNPHFLYNTLECMRAIAFYYKANEIVEISTSLSNLFRYSIKGDDYVFVREEISCIKQYLNIIKIRFMDRIHTEIVTDEEVLDLKTLKMVLQPIIENAVFHGLEQTIEGGYVKVDIRVKDNTTIQYNITDNGVGIESSRLEELLYLLNDQTAASQILHSDNRSVGLLNIYQRLKLHYGEEADMTIESRIHEGTHVQITLPIRRS